MNTIVLKKLLPYLVAAAAGGGIGYLLVSKYLEESTDVTQDNETVNRDLYAEWTKEINYMPKEIYENVEEMVPCGESEEKVLNRKVKKNKFDPKEIDREEIDYAEVWKKYNTKKPDLNKVFKERFPVEEDDKLPDLEIITREAFTNGGPYHYETQSLMYYETDSVLSLNDEKIQNPKELVSDWLPREFGTLSDDPDIVYIRNHKKETDYEVINLHESFAVSILGETEPPKKKNKNGGKRTT